MKHVLSILLACLLSLSLFAGCGKTEEPPVTGDEPIEKPGDTDKDPDKEPDENPDENPDEEPDENPDENPTKPDEEPVYTLAFPQEEIVLATVEGADRTTLAAVALCDGEPFGAEISYRSADLTVAAVEGTELRAEGKGKTTVTASFTTEQGATVSAEAAAFVLVPAEKEQVNKYQEDCVNLYGRTYVTANKLILDNVCTGIEVAFYGTQLTATIAANPSPSGKLRVFLDGDEEGEAFTLSRSGKIKLAEKLEEGVHVARILKASSPQFGRVAFDGKTAFATDGQFLTAPQKPELKIEFIGDSITAGYGAVGTAADKTEDMAVCDSTKAYAYLTARAMKADFSIIALEGICAKDGARNMYDYYPKNSFVAPTDYDPASFDADIVVLALGENDIWHATSADFTYTVAQLQEDYLSMLQLIRQYHPNAKIVCIYGMMPASASAQMKQIVTNAIAEMGDDSVTQIQMKSNATGGLSHPSAEAHITTANTLIAHLQTLLK